MKVINMCIEILTKYFMHRPEEYISAKNKPHSDTIKYSGVAFVFTNYFLFSLILSANNSNRLLTSSLPIDFSHSSQVVLSKSKPIIFLKDL